MNILDWSHLSEIKELHCGNKAIVDQRYMGFIALCAPVICLMVG